MTVVIVCSVLLAVGVLATVRWGSLEVMPPDAVERPDRPLTVLKQYVWTLSLLVWTTIATAIFVVGPAGRLAMRLLAVTAGDAAQGIKTEADELVGRISTGGTIAIFVFAGLLGAFVAVLAYLLLRRWLPFGRVGGLAAGAVVIIVFGATIEPLRADNPDFDIVGPGWLSILVFCSMALLAGMAAAAFGGRLSRWLPLPAKNVRALLPHVAIVLLAAGPLLLVLAVIVGAVVVLLSRTPVAGWMRSRPALIAGRVVIAAAVLVALPNFVGALADIAGRGP